MKKILKYGLLGVVIVLVLIAAVVGYFMATFNPNEYKPQIIQAVKDKQQRTLKLDGDIKLTLFPSIGAKVEKISLSEFKSDKEFAAVESARVSLALLPLLAKQIVVSEVGLSGVKVHVVKMKDGSTNLDDLLGKQAAKEDTPPPVETKPQAAVNFDIAAVRIENTELSYRDDSTGAQYELKNLNLKTGRIANGMPGKINLSAEIKANKPKLEIAAQLQTSLTFDLEKKLFQVEGLDMEVKGSVLEISNLLIKASGAASANLAKQEFMANALEVKVSGVNGKDNFAFNLDVPALNFTKDNVAAKKLLIYATQDGALGNVSATLSLSDMQGNAKLFKSTSLALEVELKQPEQTIKLNLSTPLAGSLEAKQINLSNLVLALKATGDKLPGKAISSEMKGSVQVDAERESVQLNLVGGLLQSNVKAKLAVKGFSEPVIRFDLDVDQFDADLYLPKKTAAAPVKNDAASEQPFDLSALKKLNLEGSVRIGSLKVANVKSSKLRIDIKASNGQVNISPLSANLYQGSMNGSIAVNAATASPSFTVKQNLSGVDVGMLLKDALEMDIIEGKGMTTVNLVTQGNTVTALKKGLNGTVGVNLDNGVIKGVDLTKMVRGAQSGLGGLQTMKPVKEDRTAFNELKATFKVTNGVARNDDLLVKSQSLKVTGNGEVDVGNSSIDYTAKATVAESVDTKNGSLTVPVQLLGPFAELKFKVDYRAVIADVAKQKVDAKKEQLKEQLQEKLKGGLQNLFK